MAPGRKPQGLSFIRMSTASAEGQIQHLKRKKKKTVLLKLDSVSASLCASSMAIHLAV